VFQIPLRYLTSMTLVVEYPKHLPDAMQLSPAEFEREAKLALAAKLFETGRLSSGLAARLAGLERVEFLRALGRYQVSSVNIGAEELSA
jgi:predicted HTH domain antitoxin